MGRKKKIVEQIKEIFRWKTTAMQKHQKESAELVKPSLFKNKAISKKEGLKVVGKIEIFEQDKNGITKKVLEKKNLIVITGLNYLAFQTGNASLPAMEYIAIGDDSTLVDETDTTLGNELARKLATVTVTANNLSLTATFNPGENVGNWKEAGVFNAAIAGIMFNHINIDYIKTSEITTTVKFTFTFNRG